MTKKFDCVVCGSCVVDFLVRPVELDKPIGGGRLLQVEPIEVATGGIVSNSGIAMTRLGLSVAAFSYVGEDDFASLLKEKLRQAGLNVDHLEAYPGGSTSVTCALIDPSGERTFLHCVGSPKKLDRAHFEKHLDLFAASRSTLLGYYSLMPSMEAELPEVLRMIRATGCQTAIDAASEGGTMHPLADCLPHLDVYVPSFAEARNQTGEEDPRKIIERFRECGAPGVLGVKLGSEGALLSAAAGEYIRIEAVTPPGDVVDTTGAGDSFYGGLIAGLLKGLSVEQAGRIAAATGACCVTGLGATAGLCDWDETCRLAGVATP
ncbi:MAG: carbohydrate kinase family protein [Pirellulales bacterium]